MNDEPQTWHYGLVARWWAEFSEADPDELAFYRQCIERIGKPALDLACGTGRLLLPLLEAGLDVDGCDGSADMLAYARERALALGLEPRLFHQVMHRLDLPREYAVIFICDSFGIGASREDDVEALKRCYRSLAPGGALVLSNDLLHPESDQWPPWLRGTFPEPWRPIEERRTAKNGDEIGLTSRTAAFDPLQRRQTREIRAALWRDGRLVAEEERAIEINLSFAHELVEVLEAAGFVDVEMRAGYSEQAATDDDGFVVFIARKPAGAE